MRRSPQFLHLGRRSAIRRSAHSIIVLVALYGTAHGQLVAPPNQSPLQSRLTMQGSGANAALTIHRDHLNRACLDIEAASRRHVINPNVYDHVISIYNRCLKLIKVRVCYFKTERCIDIEIPGQKRKDGVLGVYPNMQYFRYSYKEKF